MILGCVYRRRLLLRMQLCGLVFTLVLYSAINFNIGAVIMLIEK